MKNPCQRNITLGVGADLIASLSIGLYNNPMSVYRELIQNATDAYQEAGTPREERKIDITVDRKNRVIKVRDFATGLSVPELTENVLTIGKSHKRGLGFRGFRGIGRLATLSFCKNVIFRSRRSGNDAVHEIIWNAAEFRKHLSKSHSGRLEDVAAFISFQPASTDIEWPNTFFECELQHVVMTNRDMLLNPSMVTEYLGENCPVPFDRNFPFEREIRQIVGNENLFETSISINDGNLLHKPHGTNIQHPTKNQLLSTFHSVKPIHELNDLVDQNNTPLAKGWIIDHDYPGSLPMNCLVGGLRVRVGNMQIGSNHIFDELFKEPRFNQWLVGEIHILSSFIRPDTRRENLELSVQLEDLTNALGVFARRMIATCREKSLERKQTKMSKNNSKISVNRKNFDAICSLANVNPNNNDELTVYLKK